MSNCPGSDCRCLTNTSTVACASKPVPVTPILEPWRTMLGLSRISVLEVTMDDTVGVIVGSGVLVGAGVLWWCEPLTLLFMIPCQADGLNMPYTTAMTTRPASPTSTRFPRFLRRGRGGRLRTGGGGGSYAAWVGTPRGGSYAAWVGAPRGGSYAAGVAPLRGGSCAAGGGRASSSTTCSGSSCSARMGRTSYSSSSCGPFWLTGTCGLSFMTFPPYGLVAYF